MNNTNSAIKKNLPFWILLISAIFVLIIRDLFRDGMFMDGMIYTTVSKNLANGLGTFWHPHFSQTFMQNYHEQPTLMFGIEALFFKILGNGMYTERIYGLTIFLLSVFMIIKIWNCIFQEQTERNIKWLPLLFLLSIPICFWSYANNMEEPIMCLFTLCSVYFIYTAIILNKNIYLNLFVAGVMVIASSLCKGFQGLFPLGSIFLYWIIFRNISFKRMLIYSSILIAVVIIFYALILLNKNIYHSFELYFNNRIIGTFMNPGSTHTNRFLIIEQLISKLIPFSILALSEGIFLWIKKKYVPVKKQEIKMAAWFFLIGLSGILPLMVTKEQSDYYLVTGMPYIVMGIAILFIPSISALVNTIETKSSKYKIGLSAISSILIASIIFSIYTIVNIPKRDKEMLHDIYITGETIKEGSIIGIPNEMWSDWSLHAYFDRYYYISLDASTKPHQFYLIDKKFNQKLVLEGYKEIELPTQKYNLYKKI
jgi:hypothetical protein